MIIGGSQSVSFSFYDEGFFQRIDRNYIASGRPNDLLISAASIFDNRKPLDYFAFIRPDVAQREASLVVEAHCPIATTVTFWDTEYPAVHDDQTNITVAFDPETHLPFLVRSFEEHPIFGRTPKDLHFSNYTEVEGILFPRHQKIWYKGDSIVEETEITNISTDSTFDEGYFNGLDASETTTIQAAPKKVPGYSHALLGEFWSHMLWGGQYMGTIGGAVVSLPAADLPGAYHIIFSDGPGLAQLVLEFEDFVLIFEAPHHQTDLVIQWVDENIGKPITYLWVSHHHHDHNFDVDRFVAIGASVIVPEMAVSYWSQIPGINLVTFTEDEPYIVSDSNMQARFIWRPYTPHSADFTYAIVTSACPSADSSMLAYTADSFSTGFDTDKSVASQWLLQALDDGLSRDAIVIPAHGSAVPLSAVSEVVGSPYPPLDSTSFVRGGEICLQ
ncbi:hypothetical protein S40285_08385 [Stachybotrys chlorohalonatus IBT 40285]|uniref:Metallo-beta-lactamase domain-containing protein n=1 Tax=Stachybotrys chlorohalonatus (strain IBT 40285) TaxID=1283841 RepID=A0A084QYE3_STAC4|nr:hypothetical protein S40285_08385 [Stachybotrys chlorohalonata IBT 40285]